ADYFYEMQGNLNSIAFSYGKLGLPDSMLFYYNKSLQLLSAGGKEYPHKKDFIEMARGVIYGNIGDAYMMKQNYKVADSLYKEDILINSQKGHYNQDALMTRLKLAGLYVKIGKLDEVG